MIGITKSEFENSLLRLDVVEYYLNMTKEDIEYKFGSTISSMVGYVPDDQNHCYTLFEHILRTVLDIPTGELSNEEIKILKIAAFLHDTYKPFLPSDVDERNLYILNGKESAKIAREFLNELKYEESQIEKICFLIEHINDFRYYKDNISFYFEHHPFVRKATSRTIAEQMIENEFDFKSLSLDDIQIKAMCFSLIRDDKWPVFTDEKGNPITIKPVDTKEVKCKIPDLKKEYVPNLKDYQMLLKLCIANYKAQAKRTPKTGRIITTRQEKVRTAAIIEAMLPEAYRIYKEATEKYNVDSALTQELIDITEEYNELVAMNQVEQMREDNAKNLMAKFKDMKIRLTMKS